MAEENCIWLHCRLGSTHTDFIFTSFCNWLMTKGDSSNHMITWNVYAANLSEFTVGDVILLLFDGVTFSNKAVQIRIYHKTF